MKWTPQKAITRASVTAAWRERPSESPTSSRHVLDLGPLVVVGEDHDAKGDRRNGVGSPVDPYRLGDTMSTRTIAIVALVIVVVIVVVLFVI
jgi:hypothetical protein